ncbi:MAG: hypothetical protein M0036_05050 [Desulfobacteraceae bacterium]|nr:hypothetical protein [Desulfobacteraceae bacterium]
MPETTTNNQYRAEIAWAVWNPRTGIYYYTVNDHRSGAILAHVEHQLRLWKTCYLRGDRAVKVRLQVLHDRSEDNGQTR